MCDYFLNKVILARNFDPPMAEEIIVAKIAQHYEEPIKMARLSSNINTIEGFERLLQTFDNEGKLVSIRSRKMTESTSRSVSESDSYGSSPRSNRWKGGFENRNFAQARRENFSFTNRGRNYPMVNRNSMPNNSGNNINNNNNNSRNFGSNNNGNFGNYGNNFNNNSGNFYGNRGGNFNRGYNRNFGNNGGNFNQSNRGYDMNQPSTSRYQPYQTNNRNNNNNNAQSSPPHQVNQVAVEKPVQEQEN
jgi:hypothetical protein